MQTPSFFSIQWKKIIFYAKYLYIVSWYSWALEKSALVLHIFFPTMWLHTEYPKLLNLKFSDIIYTTCIYLINFWWGCNQLPNDKVSSIGNRALLITRHLWVRMFSKKHHGHTIMFGNSRWLKVSRIPVISILVNIFESIRDRANLTINLAPLMTWTDDSCKLFDLSSVSAHPKVKVTW